MLKIRPGKESVLQSAMEAPYEVHLVTFNSEKDFEDFSKDEERKAFLHLKEQSLRYSLLLKGKKM